MIEQIRAFLAGKKTDVTAVIALATAIVAWAGGDISGAALAAAVYTTLAAIFVRAGITASAKAVEQAVDSAANTIIRELPD